MLHSELNHKLKTERFIERTENIIVSPQEYQLLQHRMTHQDADDQVHILSMNYTVSTGELQIKRRYFQGPRNPAIHPLTWPAIWTLSVAIALTIVDAFILGNNAKLFFFIEGWLLISLFFFNRYLNRK